jgi:hypothetical protein
MANGNAPSIAYLRRFAVNKPGQPEVIRQRFYDHLIYGQAGTTQLNFFQTPVGQGVTSALGAVAGTAKTLADTNMKLAGQLPALLNFVIQSIEVTFEPGSVSTANTFTQVKPGIGAGIADAAAAQAILEKGNDADTFYKSGWLELNIGSKNYLTEAPIGAFPPKVQTVAMAALAEATGTTALAFGNALTVVKVNKAGRPYFVDPAISLMSNQNFVVSLNWPGVVAMPSGFNARIGVILDGFTYRAAQ